MRLFQGKNAFWNGVVNEAEPLAIPLPSEAAISQLIGLSYDGARTLNAVKMLAGVGDLARPAIDLMHAIFKTATVDAKTREVIILRTAKAVGCEYALRARAVIAVNTGLAGRWALMRLLPDPASDAGL